MDFLTTSPPSIKVTKIQDHQVRSYPYPTIQYLLLLILVCILLNSLLLARKNYCNFLLLHAGYNSLPRLRTGNKGGPSNLSQARRKLVNSALQDYLKSLNAMTRSIVLETESVEKEHCCDWTKMDEAKKEDIVNEHFVPSGVRLQYEDERASSCCSFSSARSLGQSSLHQDELVMESRPSHSSQPSSDWEEPTSKGILFTNKWSTTVSHLIIECKY